MCGILGYVSSENLGQDFKKVFSDSLSFLKYRGPDFSDIQYFSKVEKNIVLGHTRLSIIDLNPKANQPFLSCSGKSIISFNGEIYNYLAIKSELIKEGIQFRTNSDTEVIVNAYEKWGINTMLEKIDGMFAISLYDFDENIMYLARDRFGKKPLFYHHSKKHLIFSSDIRSVKNLLPQPPSLNISAFGYYLAELTTPEEDSIWNEIQKLKPGYYASISMKEDNNSFVTKPFWKLNFSSNCNLSFKEIVKETDLLLNQAVKKRLVADVKVSALLSGGLDSSLVVAKMAEQTSNRINTYSVISENKFHDESKYSNLVANKFNTIHTTLTINPSSLNEIEELIYEFGEPFADSSMIPSFLISKEVSKTEKVVLGGDGGDEFFGGYDTYYKVFKLGAIKQFRRLSPLANILKNILPNYRTKLLAELTAKANSPQFALLNREFCFNSTEINILLQNQEASLAQSQEHKRILEELNLKNIPDLSLVMNASLKTRLLNDYLVKVDRTSMFASLEMRSPFLDKDLASFASTFRPNQVFKDGEPKSILKAVAKSYFKDDFIYRKKMGFSIPIGDWFKNDLNKQLREKLLVTNPLISLDLNFIEKLITDHETGKANNDNKLWALFVFNTWSEQQ